MKTKTKVVETIKDETNKFGSRLISENSSRPRLIKTEKFYRHRDRALLRLGNFIDARPRLFETEKYFGCRDRDRLRLGNMSRPRLFRESR